MNVSETSPTSCGHPPILVSGYAQLSFVPWLAQGLELVNPNADKEKKVMQANKQWFDSSAGFMSAKPK